MQKQTYSGDLKCLTVGLATLNWKPLSLDCKSEMFLGFESFSLLDGSLCIPDRLVMLILMLTLNKGTMTFIYGL